MEELLVPDTPAGQRSINSQEEVEEPSCCSPTRSKLKTSPIRVFSMIHIVCGFFSIGLGIVACTFGCQYPGAAIVAGIVFVVTGVIGMLVTKHGVMAAVYGILSAFSCLLSIVLMVLMLAASSSGEGEDRDICSSHDCDYGYPDNCCYDYKFFLTWKNVAVDVGILVVAVVELVASWLATTLSLRDTNWIAICCLKQNMNEMQFPNSDQRTRAEPSDETSAVSGQSPAMKRCWKPCESKGHRNLTIVISVFHIIIGVICVALGILAVFAECEVSHIGMPIWSGLLIFVVIGIYGLLSVTKKGSYVPCFFSLSILAFMMSTTMVTWSSANIGEENINHYMKGCVNWNCYVTPTPYYDYCWDCLPGCCEIGDMSSHKDRNIRVLLDSLIVGFGVFETLICMVTFGLSFCQLSCYFCCQGSNCNCCQTKNNKQYQMVMGPNGNVMMLPIPRAAHAMPMMVQNQPMMVQNQPMMVQHQPMMLPNQLIAAQNQQVGAQTSGTGEHTGPEEQQVCGAQQPAVQAQGQPMLVPSSGQLMMVGGQGQPMMLPAQGQPMVVHQVQGQPMIVQAQGQPMMVHQGQGQPMFQQPMFVQGVGQVGMVQEQGQPTNQTVMIPGQSQPLQTVTQAQIPNHEQQIQATGEPDDNGDAMALVAGQDAGSISNPNCVNVPFL
ncbi:uncharacterized protein LOC117113230 [Anneissia japonica]|uniref:uncharacterized protein LOC117113230 n=1 Tax=Anneissia japonica TaxID=1529436 RepID=UPI0014258020|nr:uncharacterized protein LOC117113230 [Anneissia japonica]XP_033112409.1 uncharacterized protein LOC117113230 [Anneissia japonica]